MYPGQNHRVRRSLRNYPVNKIRTAKWTCSPRSSSKGSFQEWEDTCQLSLPRNFFTSLLYRTPVTRAWGGYGKLSTNFQAQRMRATEIPKLNVCHEELLTQNEPLVELGLEYCTLSTFFETVPTRSLIQASKIMYVLPNSTKYRSIDSDE